MNDGNLRPTLVNQHFLLGSYTHHSDTYLQRENQYIHASLNPATHGVSMQTIVIIMYILYLYLIPANWQWLSTVEILASVKDWFLSTKVLAVYLY